MTKFRWTTPLFVAWLTTGCGDANSPADLVSATSDLAGSAADLGPQASSDDLAPPPAPDLAPSTCGNGTVDPGEACDDGNTVTETACPYGSATCTGCTADCSASLFLAGHVCGDGVVDAAHGEACDDGNTVTETACPYGTTACTRCKADCSATLTLTGHYCGDSSADTTSGEACDDGNNVTETSCAYGTPACMACSADCSSSLALTGHYCGDSHLDASNGEVCDDGNNVTETSCAYGVHTCSACTADCSATLALTGHYCGDSHLDASNGEACDDGNNVTETSCPYGTPSCTRCTSDCSAPLALTGSYCGDGKLDSLHEVCDDGNGVTETACPYGTASCMACDATCQSQLSLTGPYCGDGVVQAAHGETCDDGGSDAGDGCDATCKVEPGYSCSGSPSVCTVAFVNLARSLRFDGGKTMTRTPATAGNTKTTTFAAWIKRSTVGASPIFTAGTTTLAFDASNKLTFQAGAAAVTTSSAFTDVGAWSHVVVAVDTAAAAASARVKVWVNGVAQTVSGTFPTQNADVAWNSATAHTLAAGGYLADVYAIDGAALGAGWFGHANASAKWAPVAYAGAYGSNGFHLDFADASATTSATLGKDRSSNDNDWTPTGFSLSGYTADSMLDVPTKFADAAGTHGNYCTLDPTVKTTSASFVLSRGNLHATVAAGGGTWGSIGTTCTFSGGSWQWEVNFEANPGSVMVGIQQDPFSNASTFGYAGNIGGYSFYSANGYVYSQGTATPYGVAWTSAPTTIRVVFNNGSLTFYVNGVTQGVFTTGLTGTFRPVISVYNNGPIALNADFGQRAGATFANPLSF